MVGLFQSQELDALEAVRRAFLESWHLAFQFRMENPRGEVGRWLARRPHSWSANIRRLDEYARNRGHDAPNLGADYGELSKLAHPTRNAAESSAALITTRLEINVEARIVERALVALERSIPAMLYRLLWLVLDEQPDLRPLYVQGENMPTAVRFVEQHPAL